MTTTDSGLWLARVDGDAVYAVGAQAVPHAVRGLAADHPGRVVTVRPVDVHPTVLGPDAAVAIPPLLKGTT